MIIRRLSRWIAIRKAKKRWSNQQTRQGQRALQREIEAIHKRLGFRYDPVRRKWI